jgi:hypothetical protein
VLQSSQRNTAQGSQFVERHALGRLAGTSQVDDEGAEIVAVDSPLPCVTYGITVRKAILEHCLEHSLANHPVTRL